MGKRGPPRTREDDKLANEFRGRKTIWFHHKDDVQFLETVAHLRGQTFSAMVREFIDVAIETLTKKGELVDERYAAMLETNDEAG